MSLTLQKYLTQQVTYTIQIIHNTQSTKCTMFFLQYYTTLSIPMFQSTTDHHQGTNSFIHSCIPLARAECDDSLPFSGASSIPLCYVLFPATILHQLFFHLLSPHLAICFLVYLSILLFPNSYIITLLGILFSSILCTCPNQQNLFSLIVSITVGFLTLA